ncbi:MAG: SecDF P1 head subdomain-containing protein, partial [Pirellulaceae bacterium]
VITEARQDYNELSGGVEVIMQMNAKGSEQWATITDNNKGRAIAIVMDEVVYSAPMVNEKITGGRSQISGNFTVDEGSDLANVLKSGTLPARAIIVDEQIIGPSLGAANVSSGINSFILAMLVVLLYMYV